MTCSLHAGAQKHGKATAAAYLLMWRPWLEKLVSACHSCHMHTPVSIMVRVLGIHCEVPGSSGMVIATASRLSLHSQRIRQ